MIIPGFGIIGACFSFLAYWAADSNRIERITEIVEGIEVSYDIFASPEVLLVLGLTGVLALIGAIMFLLQFMGQRKRIGKGRGFVAILRACWSPYGVK